MIPIITWVSSMFGPVNAVEFNKKYYVDLTKSWNLVPMSDQRRKQLAKYDKLAQKCAVAGISMESAITCKRGDIRDPTGYLTPGRKTIFVELRQWDERMGYAAKTLNTQALPSQLVSDEDGYVHLQRLCSMAGRPADAIKSSPVFIRFKELLEADIACSAMRTSNDGSTWIHPRLADFVASKTNIPFFVKVTGWLEYAKTISFAVREEHTRALSQIEADGSKDHLEHDVRDRLASELGGGIEVPVDDIASGYVDIVTEHEIIEVKRAINITHAAQAFGQLLNYKYRSGSTKAMRVHLFGTEHELEKCCDKILLRMFDEVNVRVTQEVVVVS